MANRTVKSEFHRARFAKRSRNVSVGKVDERIAIVQRLGQVG
jgi:hypothetical protein